MLGYDVSVAADLVKLMDDCDIIMYCRFCVLSVVEVEYDVII